MTPDEAIRYYTIVAGMLAILGGIGHAVYRLGRILEKFGSHVKDSTEVHKDVEQRLRVVEGRRR